MSTKTQSPKTDEEFIEHCDKVLEDINQEGFDYYFVSYESMESVKEIDPHLYRLWNQYLWFHREITTHLNTAGGRREDPNVKPNDGTGNDGG